MAFFLLQNKSISQAQGVTRLSLKAAGYAENEIRDMVASKMSEFFPELLTIATEFSHWEDSSRRLDILAVDKDQNPYVIEFKRDNDAAHAELQAIRYAAMLSVCDISDFVLAGLQYRKKLDPTVTKEAWEAELLGFLGLPDIKSVALRSIPRIMLVSSQFNKEITTTVLWLNEKFGSVDEAVPGMYIMCVEVGVYDLGGGQHALHFDQIIPISQAEEYQVKARAKELEAAKQQAMAKRPPSVILLESSGKLVAGTKIQLSSGAFKALGIDNEADRGAVFVGEGRFTWGGDGQTYNSLNSLTKALHTKYGQQMGTIQATQYWRIQSSQLSLAEEADLLASTASK